MARVNRIPADLDMAPFVERARAFLSGTTRTRAEIDEFLRENDFPRASPWGFAHWLDLVRVPPSGTWAQRRAHTFALAEEWVGPLDASEEDGSSTSSGATSLRSGPAPRTDIASWMHLKAGDLAATLERLRLRRFRDEAGKELLDLPRAPLPDPETPVPVHFLPTWDAALLGTRAGRGSLPEQYRPVIFSTRIPPSIPTFLVDRAVAGTWQFERGRIELGAVRARPRSASRAPGGVGAPRRVPRMAGNVGR